MSNIYEVIKLGRSAIDSAQFDISTGEIKIYLHHYSELSPNPKELSLFEGDFYSLTFAQRKDFLQLTDWVLIYEDGIHLGEIRSRWDTEFEKINDREECVTSLSFVVHTRYTCKGNSEVIQRIKSVIDMYQHQMIVR